ncbi:MAG: QueG-associated DUF1730 domain-containing protein, partial [Sulfurifustaceae bacterium]
MSTVQSLDLPQLAEHIKQWGRELGFQQLGIAATTLDDAEAHLLNWLRLERHGEMHYMAAHGTRRSRPADLVPGTVRVISARLDYFAPAADAEAVLADPNCGYVSRYALGRDYHKVLRGRLRRLAQRIEA